MENLYPCHGKLIKILPKRQEADVKKIIVVSWIRKIERIINCFSLVENNCDCRNRKN